MIQLSSAGKRYGHKLLFEEADWLITPKDRVGLVGANGTGKSTLLKILGGMETLDYGTLSTAKGLSFGYLPQDGLSLSGRSVFAECMSVFDELRAMAKKRPLTIVYAARDEERNNAVVLAELMRDGGGMDRGLRCADRDAAQLRGALPDRRHRASHPDDRGVVVAADRQPARVSPGRVRALGGPRPPGAAAVCPMPMERLAPDANVTVTPGSIVRTGWPGLITR